MANFPVHIRESVRALGLSLIMLELLYFIIYTILFILLLLNTEQVPQNAVSLAATFFLIIFLGLNISKIAFSLLFVLHWLSHQYQIREGEVLYMEGLISRREKMFSLMHVEDIVISQTFLGRIFNFGTIRLHNPVLNKKFYMYSVPNPEFCAQLIHEAIKEGGERESGGGGRAQGKVSIIRDDRAA